MFFFNKASLNHSARYISGISYDPYFLLDARLNVDLPRQINLFAEVTNISDTDYMEAGFVQMPGRWLRAGFSIRLKKKRPSVER